MSMSDRFDFERTWRDRFSRAIEGVAGLQARDRIMQGAEALPATSPPDEIIAWSCAAMERLDATVAERGRRAIMTACACRYPTAGLEEIRGAYVATGDVTVAHRMLQERFTSFLREGLGLSATSIAEIVGRGWGLAGILAGRRIIATKIPKSGNLLAYLREDDPVRRRELYCHCPRIRGILATDAELSATYCYCGAGFYKSIWETILQEPVEVELLETVLAGGDACRIAIDLPPACAARRIGEEEHS
jgi:hypothetical protein